MLRVLKKYFTFLTVLLILFSGCKDLFHQEGPDSVSDDKNNNGTGNQLLNAPTDVKATALSDNSIRVSWNTVQGAIIYKVYFGPPGDSNPLSSESVATTTYDYNKLVPNSNYYFKVAAINSEGEGKVSSIVSAKTNPVSDTGSSTGSGTGSDTNIDTGKVPKAPYISANAACTQNVHRCVITWEKVDGATNYAVYWSYDPNNFSHYSSFAISGDQTSYTVGFSIENQANRYYALRSWNKYGYSDFSNVVIPPFHIH